MMSRHESTRCPQLSIQPASDMRGELVTTTLPPAAGVGADGSQITPARPTVILGRAAGFAEAASVSPIMISGRPAAATISPAAAASDGFAFHAFGGQQFGDLGGSGADIHRRVTQPAGACGCGRPRKMRISANRQKDDASVTSACSSAPGSRSAAAHAFSSFYRTNGSGRSEPGRRAWRRGALGAPGCVQRRRVARVRPLRPLRRQVGRDI